MSPSLSYTHFISSLMTFLRVLLKLGRSGRVLVEPFVVYLAACAPLPRALSSAWSLLLMTLWDILTSSLDVARGRRMRKRISPHLGRVVDLLIGLFNLIQEIVMLLLEQGVLGVEEISYLNHLSNNQICRSSSPLGWRAWPSFLVFFFRGSSRSARKGLISHSYAGHPARLYAIPIDGAKLLTLKICRLTN